MMNCQNLIPFAEDPGAINHPPQWLCVGYPRCKQTGYYAHTRASAAHESNEPSAGESSHLPPQGAEYSASLNKYPGELLNLLEFELFRNFFLYMSEMSCFASRKKQPEPGKSQPGKC